jgi:hypothetical protein
MTRLLEKGFETVAELPEGEQNDVAALILEALEAERRWDGIFQSSKDELTRLAPKSF